MLKRLLKPIVEVTEDEALTALLMFAYSFLAMTVWNILKPITRSKFIADLGADNLPYVLFAAGIVIGVIMQGYSKVTALLPRKWVIPIVQGASVGVLVGFWLAFQGGAEWASAAFYFFGLIFSVLLISQFWTLANDIFDPRQAKRIFGFIGAGSSLGGIMGSSILQFAKQVGTNNLLLVSASLLVVCIGVVVTVLYRHRDVQLAGIASTGEEAGVSGGEALRLLRSSKHLQLISLVIGFAAVGAAIIEQQLNMAVEATQGGNTDNITALLGQVQLYLSIIGFVIQIWLTSKIQRYLGIGFALLLLPTSLGASGLLILASGALWSTMVARVADTSLRYTVDKTTREILFLPLPTELKYQAKPFVDVTMDRFSKGVGGLVILLLIKPWGLGLTWRQLSFASVTMVGLWVIAAMAAKRGYLSAFRRSIERHDVEAAEVRIQAADLSTIETLITELAHPDEKRVIYAIDLLESLEKRSLVTPLLLYHESPRVRARALKALGEGQHEITRSWEPQIRKMLADSDGDVRVAAIGALATLLGEDAAAIVRPYLDHADARIATAAASVLARSGRAADVDAAEAALTGLAGESGEAAAEARREVARAVRQIRQERFNALLVPLLGDPDPAVAEEAMESVRQAGAANFIFVPALVSLLRHRRLKSAARQVLVGYGEDVVDSLAYFLNDKDEDIWVRRHIPATLARIPAQKSMDVLAAALGAEPDGFLRYKLLTGIERLHREHPELTFDTKVVEALVLRESRRFCEALSLHHNLFVRDKLDRHVLLGRALEDRMSRTTNRLWLLLGLLYPWKDVAAARWAIERGDAKARSSGLESLDNLFPTTFRRRVLPVIEDMAADERVQKANVILGTRPRGAEETLLQLINDEDEVLAASAIHLVAATKMWTLADDLEHVLAHRDVRDFHVFQAVSWALAEHRMPPERRRALWLEPLPSVEIAARLSQLPLFGRTSADELFRFAGTGQQARYEAGKALYAEGAMPDSLQFLLDGQVVATRRDGGVDEQHPPAALGFEEVLQGAPMAATVRTTDTCVCQVLSNEEARTLLADNTDLVSGLFGTMVDHPSFAARRALLKGSGDGNLTRFAAEGVKPVEKALALQRLDLFAQFPTEVLVELANIARAVSFKAGDTLAGEGDAPAILFVLTGTLALESPREPSLHADAGDAVGVYETLASQRLGRGVRGTQDGAALRIPADDLFDLLGQRPDVLRHFFTALLGTQARAAAA